MAMDRAEERPTEGIDAWEQVWQGTSETAAEIVAGRLEADGIRSNVRGHSFQERTIPFALQGAWPSTFRWPVAGLARVVLRAYGEAEQHHPA